MEFARGPQKHIPSLSRELVKMFIKYLAADSSSPISRSPPPRGRRVCFPNCRLHSLRATREARRHPILPHGIRDAGCHSTTICILFLHYCDKCSRGSDDDDDRDHDRADVKVHAKAKICCRLLRRRCTSNFPRHEWLSTKFDDGRTGRSWPRRRLELFF